MSTYIRKDIKIRPDLKRLMNLLYTLTYFIWLIPLRLYDILHGTEFAGIEKTVEFFKSIDMPVSLSGLGINPSDEDITALALDATMKDTVKLSRIRPLGAEDVAKIYRAAL